MRKCQLVQFLMVLLVFPLAGCSTSLTPINPSSTPAGIVLPASPTRSPNFNFVFKYGVGPEPKNILDTFQNTFTLDMLDKPALTVNLSLTQEDLNTIYQKMQAIDFFSYPEDFNDRIPPGQPQSLVNPAIVYYFKVTDGTTIKEVGWNTGMLYQDQKAVDLESLTRLIQDIIAAKNEYKQMPRPTSGYM